jgi:serine/threonine protein kinase
LDFSGEMNMSDRDDLQSDHEKRVGEAVAWYYQAVEKGNPPGSADFLARYPDLRSELESFLADKDVFRRIVGPPLDPNATLPPSQHSENATAQYVPAADLTATSPPSNLASKSDGALGSVRYFGDYELLAEIARGGMGVVFRARQVSLNREVALKMILTGQLASAADVARFHAEAEAAANLDHPNILPIYEIGEHLGQQYFSMKLIDGGSLADTIRGKAISEQQAAELLVKVARAIHHAHQRGILHRDLKPANILLARAEDNGFIETKPNESHLSLSDLTPYVTDFGLAKKVEGDSALTHTGTILGTPSYMAPEQARAEKVLTIAVDIYSLGAILYEVLTGLPPFKAATTLDTILQVLEQEPADPRRLNPVADRDLSAIALKCLAKEPAKRYKSALLLSEDLQRWLEKEPTEARNRSRSQVAVSWVSRHPAATILGLVVIGLLLASGGFRNANTIAQTVIALLVMVGTVRARFGIQSLVTIGTGVLLFAIAQAHLLPDLPPFRSHGLNFGRLERSQQQYLEILVWLPVLVGVVVGNFAKKSMPEAMCYFVLIAIGTTLSIYVTPSLAIHHPFFPTITVLVLTIRFEPSFWWGPLVGAYWGVLGKTAQKFFGGNIYGIIGVAYVFGHCGYALSAVFVSQLVAFPGPFVVQTYSTYGMLGGTCLGAWIGSRWNRIARHRF